MELVICWNIPHARGLYQTVDPSHIEFETQNDLQDNTGDKRFYTDLWKIGLSVLSMLIGYNPVTRLLDTTCNGARAEISAFLYMMKNISDVYIS
jgi:hypothetical protein